MKSEGANERGLIIGVFFLRLIANLKQLINNEPICIQGFHVRFNFFAPWIISKK